MTISAEHPEIEDPETAWARRLWLGYLTGDATQFDQKAGRLRKIFRWLPSDPRCKVCLAPFRGIGSLVVRPLGFSATAWEMNPNLCNSCENVVKKHEVGVDVQVTMLFADVRGSTPLSERLGPERFHHLIDRFYRTSTRILIDADALIEKLIGDEVAGLFVPGLAGPDYTSRAIRAAEELIQAVSDDTLDDARVEIGAGVHTGQAYVGAVGSTASMSVITVLGEAANTTARLASAAGPGEVLVSKAAWDMAAIDDPVAEQRTLDLKGVAEPVEVKVLLPASKPPLRTFRRGAQSRPRSS